MIYCSTPRLWYGCLEYAWIYGINKRHGANIWLSIFFTLKVNFVMLYYQTTVQSSERYASRWSYLIFAIFMHAALISIIQVQRKYGSRFFLPHRFRKYGYQYLKFIENEFLAVDIDRGNVPYCELWLGTLDTGGMLDLDLNNKKYEMLKQHIGIYAETPCEHTFHYTCLCVYLNDHDSWPVCQEILSELIDYDD